MSESKVKPSIFWFQLVLNFNNFLTQYNWKCTTISAQTYFTQVLLSSWVEQHALMIQANILWPVTWKGHMITLMLKLTLISFLQPETTATFGSIHRPCIMCHLRCSFRVLFCLLCGFGEIKLAWARERVCCFFVFRACFSCLVFPLVLCCAVSLRNPRSCLCIIVSTFPDDRFHCFYKVIIHCMRACVNVSALSRRKRPRENALYRALVDCAQDHGWLWYVY